VFPDGESYDAIYCFNVLHLLRSGERHNLLAKCHAALREGGLAYFTVFSEKEPGFGKGRETEPGTFESKPGRPVHYFTDGDLGSHFKDYVIRETGLVEDAEDHGDEGPHVHVLRYVLAIKM
jgi:SAM-dependent methyltransferase